MISTARATVCNDLLPFANINNSDNSDNDDNRDDDNDCNNRDEHTDNEDEDDDDHDNNDGMDEAFIVGDEETDYTEGNEEDIQGLP